MAFIKHFRAKPSKSGNSYVFTIPMHLIKSDIIKPDSFYKIDISEVISCKKKKR